MADPVTGCIGKLPIHGDFIRRNDRVPELGHLDAWLEEGLHRSQQALGPSFASEFDAVTPCCFRYACVETGGTLVGVWRPSRDRTGRRYPFVLAARTEDPKAAQLDLLPFAAADFLAAAMACAQSGWTGLDLAGFTARVAEVRWQPQLEVAAPRLASELARTPAETLWRSALGEGPGGRELLLEDLRAVLQQPFPPRLVLRIGSSGEPAEIAFWLAVARAWAPSGAEPTITSWAPAAGAAGHGFLCLLFDRASSRYFQPIFWDKRPSEHRYDLGLTSPAAAAARATAAAERFGGAVAVATNLHDLLQRVLACGVR